MTKEELKIRTRTFSLRIIRLVEALPNTKAGNANANQLIRSGTSVGANYRSACRAKSDKDFVNKINIVEEEVDETLFWLELIEEANLLKPDLLKDLKIEAHELTSIFTATGKAMKKKLDELSLKNPKSARIGGPLRNPK